jgi:endonuclease/exonuclease/phosphatase (EEP) superfamily protein YafD
MIWLIRISGFLLLLITLLPLISTGRWYIRWWDFPRLQIAILLFILLAISLGQLLTSGFQFEPIVWAIAILAGAVWQTSHVIPFSPFWKTEVPTASKNSQPIKLLVANLDYENQNFGNVSDELAEEQAEILLLIEFSDTWDKRLKKLRSQYRYHLEEIRGEGLGMAIWSKLPLSSAEIKHLISDRRASLWASVTVTSGHVINFVGVHPTPPGLLDSTGETRRDSRVRDAELILIAREIAARKNESWIVAGDFNDVAWSHTTRLFKRLSGMLDPRVGRGMYNTYIAQYPPCRCPIDHVFVSEGFAISSLARKRITGSDHFGVITSFNLSEPSSGVSPDPKADDKLDAKDIIEEGKNDAEDRDVLPPSN